MSRVFCGWIRFIGSTVNTENIRLISSGESSRYEVRAEILFMMSIGTLNVEKFTNKHFRRETDVATVAVRKGQSNVIWGKDEAPCLFDLKKKFCFQSAKWKVQLMTIQALVYVKIACSSRRCRAGTAIWRHVIIKEPWKRETLKYRRSRMVGLEGQLSKGLKWSVYHFRP